MWIYRIFLLFLIKYRKRKMLRLALNYGMSSVEVLAESIFIDGLINKLTRIERRKGSRTFSNSLPNFRKSHSLQCSKDISY